MNAMKYLLMMTLFISVAYAEVTCESKAAASCLSPDGMCAEFFADEGDEGTWEGLCEQMEGTYSASACETSKSVLKCLTATNPVAQMLYFLDPMTSSDAEMTCNLLQGNICQ